MSKMCAGIHGAIMGVMLLSAGCTTVEDYSLTYKLWNNPQLRHFAEPAPDPHLSLFDRRQNNDVLVQYDEIREQNEVVRRRAYFLQQNAERIGRQEKPHFVDPQLATTMAPIPQSETPPGSTNLAPTSCSLVAMSTKGGHEFLLFRNDTTEGPYGLPTYLESNGNFLKVALTPFAIAGDTVLVGLVASVAAAYIYAAGTIHSYPTP
jgi:hypothetical protein